MRYPDFLKENGTIGFVAPSFGCKLQPYRAAFENACKKWKELGYQLDLGPNCFAGEGIVRFYAHKDPLPGKVQADAFQVVLAGKG